MSVEDLNGWRERVPEMSDEQIKQMLHLENNQWVKSSPAVAAQQPQHNDFAEAAGLTGGYEFDPAALNEIIRECEDLRDDLDKDGIW